MELTDSLKTLLLETAKALKGSTRRLFMARTVKELGPGGQQRAARELRWGRMTIRKGMHELDQWCDLSRCFYPAWAEACRSASLQPPDGYPSYRR